MDLRRPRPNQLGRFRRPGDRVPAELAHLRETFALAEPQTLRAALASVIEDITLYWTEVGPRKLKFQSGTVRLGSSLRQLASSTSKCTLSTPNGSAVYGAAEPGCSSMQYSRSMVRRNSAPSATAGLDQACSSITLVRSNSNSAPPLMTKVVPPLSRQ